MVAGEVAGLAKGGVVEVRPVKDGRHSLLLTPKPARKRGASGLLYAFAACPFPLPPAERHALPGK